MFAIDNFDKAMRIDQGFHTIDLVRESGLGKCKIEPSATPNYGSVPGFARIETEFDRRAGGFSCLQSALP